MVVLVEVIERGEKFLSSFPPATHDKHRGFREGGLGNTITPVTPGGLTEP